MKNTLLILTTLLAFGACFLAGRWSMNLGGTSVTSVVPGVSPDTFESNESLRLSVPREPEALVTLPFTSAADFLQAAKAITDRCSAEWKQLLARLDKSDTEKLYLELTTEYSLDHSESFAAVALLQSLAKHRPDRAWQLADETPNDDCRRFAMSAVMREWAKQNPGAAWKKIQEHDNDDPSTKHWLMTAFLGEIAKTDPQRGIEIIRNISPEYDIYKWDGVEGFFATYASENLEAAKKLASTLGEPHRLHALAGIATKLAATDPAAALALLDKYPPKQWENLFFAGRSIIQSWMEKDMPAALAALENMDNRTAVEYMTRSAMEKWSETDFDAALAYTMQLGNPSTAMSILHNLAFNTTHHEAVFKAIVEKLANSTNRPGELQTIIANWATADPAAAAAAIKALPAGYTQYTAMANLMETWLKNATDKNAPFNWALALPQGAARDQSIATIVGEWAKTDPAAASAAYYRLSPVEQTANMPAIANAWAQSNPASLLDWARKLPEGESRTTALDTAIPALAQRDPAQALAALKTLPVAQQTPTMISNFVTNWSNQNLDAASTWTKSLPDGEARNQSLVVIGNRLLGENPAAALAWAAAIADPALRKRTTDNYYNTWSYRDPAAAKAWKEQNP